MEETKAVWKKGTNGVSANPRFELGMSISKAHNYGNLTHLKHVIYNTLKMSIVLALLSPVF